MSEYVPSVDAVEAASKILNDEGGLPGHSIHSWRCEDKERYPDPCDCVEQTTADMLTAAMPIELAELLADAWDEGYSHREWHLVRNRVPNPYRTTEGEKS